MKFDRTSRVRQQKSARLPLFFLSVAFSICAASDLLAESWPQFRGPGGQGQISHPSLPQVWKQQHGVLWKTPIPGLGHSSPVHDENTIWLTTAPTNGSSLQALALDAQTGTLLKTVTIFTPAYREKIHFDNSYASPTSVFHNKRLYVHFGTYGTACINTDTAEVIWKNTDFPVAHDGGPGSSPVLFEDLLIITLDGADSQRVIALDCQTGSPRWIRSRSAPYPNSEIERRAFSTPLIIEHGGRTMLISPAAQQCHAYDPRTGEELWHVRYSGFSNVPRPVYDGARCFICTGFYKPQLWAIDPSGMGDVTDTHVDWKFRGAVPNTPSPVLCGDFICLLSNQGVLTLLNRQTGKRFATLRVGGNYSSSPIAADGLIYICNEAGDVKIIDTRLPSPRVIQVNRMHERIMASPAVIGNDLLIRTVHHIYRISGQENTGEAQEE